MTAPVPVTPTEAREAAERVLPVPSRRHLDHSEDCGTLARFVAALPAEPAADARLAAAREEGRQEFLTRWGPDAESYAAMTSRLAAVQAAARALLDAQGRVCRVCTGESPRRDGHDRDCEERARERLTAALSGAAPAVVNDPSDDCGKGDDCDCAPLPAPPSEDDTERVETCAYGPCDLPPEPGGRAYCTIHGVKWGRGS